VIVLFVHHHYSDACHFMSLIDLSFRLFKLAIFKNPHVLFKNLSSSLFCCSSCWQVFLSFYFVVVLSISSIKTWMKLWHIFSLHIYVFLCFMCRLGFVIGTLLLPLHQNNMLLMSSIKASMKLSHSISIVHLL
jgi:hypothetical protein